MASDDSKLADPTPRAKQLPAPFAEPPPTAPDMDVPVQFFQSVIAIELAVAGARLWQLRFFESGDRARRESGHLPDSRLRLGLGLILGATLFGSL